MEKRSWDHRKVLSTSLNCNLSRVSKKWCGSIFFYGYSETLDVNFEGLGSLLFRL